MMHYMPSQCGIRRIVVVPTIHCATQYNSLHITVTALELQYTVFLLSNGVNSKQRK